MSDYDDRHWHLDKRINLSHMAGSVSLVVAVMVWGTSVETRLALGEKEDSHQIRLLEDIRQEGKETNKKMDKFLEKHYLPKGQ